MTRWQKAPLRPLMILLAKSKRDVRAKELAIPAIYKALGGMDSCYKFTPLAQCQ